MQTLFPIRAAKLIVTLAVAFTAGCNMAIAPGDDADAIDTSMPETIISDNDTGTEVIEETADVPPPVCEDHDGDGYGPGCELGADCNDDNPSETSECYRCVTPSTGCECTTENEQRPCDVTTDSTAPGPDGLCHLGARICVNGRWSRCFALDQQIRTIVPPSSCNNICDPTCQHSVVCPTTPTEITAGGRVVIGSQPPPAFCPTGTPNGGIRLEGGVPGGGAVCTTPCGSECCLSTQSCYNLAGTNPTGSACGTITTPAEQRCGRTCNSGEIHCGDAPNDQCCAAGQVCDFGVCRTPQVTCQIDPICQMNGGQFCGRCYPQSPSMGVCNCDSDGSSNLCYSAISASGGQIYRDIFHTTMGRDARSLRFARYLFGLTSSGGTTPAGRSNASGGTYACATCSPANCQGSQSFAINRMDDATVGLFANALDWTWVEHHRLNTSGTNDTTGSNIVPTQGLVFDLGAPSNEVALFSIRDNAVNSCTAGTDFTVWVSDNPWATQVETTGTFDPAKWNRTTLRRVYTEGWTMNPASLGNSADTTNLNSSTGGVAVADGPVTVWGIPCGASARYVAVSSGNDGSSGTSSCARTTVRNRIDAIAGLNQQGNPVAIEQTIPYGGRAGPTGMAISSQVRSADIYLLIDTTNTMSGEIANLRSSVTSGEIITGCPGGLIGAIRCIIPDAWFGLGRQDDIGVGPYGFNSGPQNLCYYHRVSMTPDQDAVATSVNGLTIRGTSNQGEGQTPALWGLATTAGLPPYWNATTCPTGRLGYPCFRPGAIPVVVHFSDAPFNAAPLGQYPYNDYWVFVQEGYNFTYPTSTAVTGNDVTPRAMTNPTAPNGVHFSGSTTGLTNNFNPSCELAGGGLDVAFQFTLTTRSFVHLDTFNSNFDTVLAVTRSSDGTELFCNDDYFMPSEGTPVYQSVINETFEPGTYTVWVDGTSAPKAGLNGVGNYRLRYGIYPSIPPQRTPTFAQMTQALNNLGIRYVGINSGIVRPDMTAVANATNSLVGGVPAVYDINSDGTGLSTTVVDAIRDLANFSRLDITAVAEDNLTTAIDERLFIANPTGTPLGTVRLANGTTEGAPYPAGRCTGLGTSPGGVPYIARGCLPGTSGINFQAEFVNNLVQSTTVEQVFTFDVVTYGNNRYELGRVPVTIRIPPIQPYEPVGTFSQEFDASTLCTAGQLVQWSQLQFVADTPTGSSVFIEARTSQTAGMLPSAPAVALGTIPPATSPIDLAAYLTAAGQSVNYPYLRLNFTLRSNPARTVTPTVSGFRVVFNCIDGT